MYQPSSLIRWSAICGYCLPFLLVPALLLGGFFYARHQLSRIVYNGTPSSPRGFYWQTPVRFRPFARGDLVVFPQPASVRALIQERHWLPERAVFLKKVVALPGDRVCTRDDQFLAAGRLIGPIPRNDSLGRPLPSFHFCGTVPMGFLFVGSTEPRSFDSRYFGPIRINDVSGVAEPIWTF